MQELSYLCKSTLIEIILKLNIFTVEITGEQGVMLAYQDASCDGMIYTNGCLLQHPSVGAPAAIPDTEGWMLTWHPSPYVSGKWQR